MGLQRWSIRRHQCGIGEEIMTGCQSSIKMASQEYQTSIKGELRGIKRASWVPIMRESTEHQARGRVHGKFKGGGAVSLLRSKLCGYSHQYTMYLMGSQDEYHGLREHSAGSASDEFRASMGYISWPQGASNGYQESINGVEMGHLSATRWHHMCVERFRGIYQA